MEPLMIQRLAAVIDQIDSLSGDALVYEKEISDKDLEEAEILASKLETSIARFNTELHTYFRLSREPSADEIAAFSASQLKGEETLAELKVKINRKTARKITSNSSTEGMPVLSSRLPKLSLPEFDGNILEWHQFWDQFMSNIGERHLAEVDKLLYLKASLKGEAKKSIDGLETTNKNYQIAVSTLKERYGREAYIIDAHYSALYRVKAADKTASDCRRTLNDVERHLRVLDSLGEDVNRNHLRFLIMEKFPEDVVYEMKLRMSADSIGEIRKNLEIIVSAREDASRITQDKGPTESSNYTAETLHVGVANRQNWPNRGQFVRKFRGNDRRPRQFPNNNRPFPNSNRPFSNNTQQFPNNNQPFPNNNRPLSNNTRQFPNNSRQFHGNSNGNKTFGRMKRAHTCYAGNGEPQRKKRKRICAFCQGGHRSDKCDVVTTLGERKDKLKGRCFVCLSSEHKAKECTSRTNCWYCKRNTHNRALCPTLFSKPSSTNTFHLMDRSFTVLQTAIVKAKRSKDSTEQIKCRVLMDSGSQRSYVTERIATELNLPIEEENRLSVFTFGSKTPQVLESPVVKLHVDTRTNDAKTLFMNVVPIISQGVPYPEMDIGDWKEKITLADDGSLLDQIDILIGNDYYYSLMSTKKIQLEENLFLVDSVLGWIVSGKIELTPVDELSALTYFQSNSEVRLNQPDLPLDKGNVKLLWELEAIGITDSPKVSRDEEAVRNFNETTKCIDNRYAVCWPWNEYPPTIPTNFGLAYGRLVSQLKRLNEETLLLYDQTLREQMQKGIIEIAPKPTRNSVNNPIHYLPHHGVIQPGKPNRIVYDASAKTKDNKSLNECLYCGPMMLEDLTGLLLRFRSHPIGISADVEKAFLQISLQERDRDVTRFLWLKDITKPASEDNLIHMRFCRVPFGIISSPFLLNATIRHHLMKSKDERIKQIASDIYVDNLVSGTQTTQEAKALYKNSKREFEKISMNLREWSSNSKEFMKSTSDACEDNIVKILGLSWTLEDDSIQLRSKTTNTNANTKRGILKIVASVYDPCGYAVPSVLPAKLILQDLWKLKVKWDTPLSREMTDEWIEAQRILNDIQRISLPRCYARDARSKEWQLHCFTDASTKAYAAVIYLVNGRKSSFVIGKSRLAPIKDQENLKIPRLELLGVLIGTRLIKYVLSFIQLNVTQQILWTDSQIVIDWYNSNKLLAPFVARRIEEIKQNKRLIIKYVPSELNPADIATRPTISEGDNDRWLAGPQFLRGGPDAWPTTSPNISSFVAAEDLTNVDIAEPENPVDPMEVEYDLDKDCEQLIDQSKESVVQEDEDEMYNIQDIKNLQKEYFPEEVNGKETNLSRSLVLFKDVDDILRCKGRLKHADWSFDKRYPILIPKDCEFTNKTIMKLHEKNYHAGVNHTLSIIRQSYWIPQGKSQVQKILKKCQRCIKHGGGPYKLPPTPALPPERVNYSSPFTFTGLDLLGPVLVNTQEGTTKRWICLFTCLAVRAVHLEIVQDLTAEEGLLALRRMISTRGVPALITSDNASQFKLISEILEKPYCVENKIRWRFIPQLAPWFGGFYERLVGMVKHCLKRTLQKHLLKDSQLVTIVKEIEAVLNMRPLTCVDSELDHILKPADFLTMGKCITTITSRDNPSVLGTTTKSDLVKGWRRALIILGEFKEMFSNRYLPSLRERYWHSHKEPRVTSRMVPCEGQIVQIKGDSKNREGWKVGKIVSLVKGTDGLTRVAKVRVGKTEYVRSISQLYPLEIEDIQEEELTNKPDSLQTHVCKPNYVKPNNTTNIETERAMLQPEVIGIDNSIEDKEVPENIESIHELENTDMTENTKEPDIEEVDTSETRPRRDAATRALEKIREWTRSLVALF